jgi:hypothetical protein
VYGMKHTDLEARMVSHHHGGAAAAACSPTACCGAAQLFLVLQNSCTFSLVKSFTPLV